MFKSLQLSWHHLSQFTVSHYFTWLIYELCSEIAVITGEPAIPIKQGYRVNTMLVILFTSHLHTAIITAIGTNFRTWSEVHYELGCQSRWMDKCGSASMEVDHLQLQARQGLASSGRSFLCQVKTLIRELQILRNKPTKFKSDEYLQEVPKFTMNFRISEHSIKTII